MHRVQTPFRPVDEVSLTSAAYFANNNYWREGAGYEITRDQADELRSAVSEMIARYKDAMDYVVSKPSLLERFYFVDDVEHNRAIQDLATASWKTPAERSYVMDRWDIAWNGNGAPKLLERNFGYLGLVESTGVLQEEYIGWLKQQPKYGDASSFGDLRQNFIQSFREVASDRRILESANVALIVERENALSDKGMICTSDVLAEWVKAAGYVSRQVHNAYASGDALGLVMTKQEIYKTLESLEDFLKKSGEPTRGVHFAVNFVMENNAVQLRCKITPDTRQLSKSKKKASKLESGARPQFNVPKESWDDAKRLYAELQADTAANPAQGVYPYVNFDTYIHDYARLRNNDDILGEGFTVMQPAWVQLMGHKAMQPVLHELFPEHPNFLKTVRGLNGIPGKKSFAKHVNSCQGRGGRVIAADGQVARKRRSFGDQSRKYYSSRNYISQEYCDAVPNSDGSHKVMHVFTTNERPAAVGTRESQSPFVGGANTGTHFVPVIVRNQLSLS